MRGLLLPLSLVLAAAATAGLVLIVARGTGGGPGPAPDGAGAGDAAPPPGLPSVRERKLRPYETTLTLAEDLRDALPGPSTVLAEELWRVSRSLETRANWTLEKMARQEASPRVRALLVLAAGVHVPDAAPLLRFLDDPHPAVRTAAALACGYRDEGAAKASLFGTIAVPVGRRPEDPTRAKLARRYGEEKDVSVRAAIDLVLSAAR